MRYVRSRWYIYQRDLAYRIYETDGLQIIGENTTHISSINGVVDYGRAMTMRWYDIINPTENIQETEETRSVSDITADIWNKIKGGDSSNERN